MPPHSKHLWEEGARFKTFKIVKGGVFQENELIEELNAPGKYPGCSGTRLLQDNLSDLKAQIGKKHALKIHDRFIPNTSFKLQVLCC